MSVSPNILGLSQASFIKKLLSVSPNILRLSQVSFIKLLLSVSPKKLKMISGKVDKIVAVSFTWEIYSYLVGMQAWQRACAQKGKQFRCKMHEVPMQPTLLQYLLCSENVGFMRKQNN